MKSLYKTQSTKDSIKPFEPQLNEYEEKNLDMLLFHERKLKQHMLRVK
jgi:hypothetical protein